MHASEIKNLMIHVPSGCWVHRDINEAFSSMLREMTRVGDRVRCPECGGEARVVWVSQDGMVAAVRCPGHHSHINPSNKRLRQGQTIKKRGMVFFVAIPEK